MSRLYDEALKAGPDLRRLRADANAQAAPSLRLTGVTMALWTGMFAVFALSPVLQMNDSEYSMLTAKSLIQFHTPDLSGYAIPEYDEDLPFATVRGKHPYQLARTNGRLLYGFSHGSSFLSIPFVALGGALGVSPATHDERFDVGGELLLHKFIAAFVSASMVIVLFRTAALVLSVQWSVIVAVGAGLGTQVWSTASRGMWSHTWEMMLGGCVVYLLMASEFRGCPVHPVILATLLSWMFFVRPTGAVAAVCVGSYVMICSREEFLLLAATGLGWLTAFIAYSISVFGSVVPYYYLSNDPHSLGLHIATGLYGVLLSPSRGVFIFCPIVGWAIFVVVRFWYAVRSRPLAITAMCVSAAIVLAASSHPEWWGGACYGPRLMSDAVPWFFLLAVLGLDAMPLSLRQIRNPSIIAGLLLLTMSIAMNGEGAWSNKTMTWNFTGPSPAIMLDWSRPQFLAAWQHQPMGKQ